MTLSHGRKGAEDVTSSGVKELENDANVTLPTFSVLVVEGQDGTSADSVLTESRPSAMGRHLHLVLYLYRNGGYRMGAKQ